MSKVIEFIKNEHIVIALCTGVSIIVISLAFKRVLHIQPTGLESSLPGFAFLGFELARARKAARFWTRPLPWCILCLLITAAVIVRRLI